MPRERILFVTGRLAEPALRRVLEPLAARHGFDHAVTVLPISVAALMHVGWVLRKLSVTSRFDRIVLPGWCEGDLSQLAGRFQMPCERGPKDLHDLPQYLGAAGVAPAPLDRYDIEILAEINHAPRLSVREVLRAAKDYRDSGADVIDLGCVPGESWNRAGDVTRMLLRDGFRVSIDSFDRAEVEAAVEAGAELVLSCNSSNVEWAERLEAEVVAIPDDPSDLRTLVPTIGRLQTAGARFRIDPVIEPIGFGFAASLERYFTARRTWPKLPIMMGVGNVTEMTEVDSAGVNVLLAAICQELRIGSVLTTEVINWARTAVREFDLARRLVRHAVTERTLPKHVDPRLVLLRDPRSSALTQQELAELSTRLTDPNFRIFVAGGELHLMNRDGYWHGTDAYELFDRATADSPVGDAAHAFYLGYELAKAATALTLGKQYTQDAALRWGFLTVEEASALERRRCNRTCDRRQADDDHGAACDGADGGP